MTELSQFINLHKIHILAVCESWLSDLDTDLSVALPGFQVPFRKDRKTKGVTTPVSRRPTLQGTTLLNLQYRDGSRLRDQNEDTKQKAQYLYTATQHLTQHRDRNASDNSMNITPADLQITAETEVLHYSPPP